MRTYYIPRNLKGETRILLIFSTKSLIFTAIGLMVGVIPFFIVRAISGRPLISAILLIIPASIGYIIGTCKIPDNKSIRLFKNVGGETIDEVLKRWLKFNGKLSMFGAQSGKKVYTYYTKEEEK